MKTSNTFRLDDERSPGDKLMESIFQQPYWFEARRGERSTEHWFSGVPTIRWLPLRPARTKMDTLLRCRRRHHSFNHPSSIRKLRAIHHQQTSRWCWWYARHTTLAHAHF